MDGVLGEHPDFKPVVEFIQKLLGGLSEDFMKRVTVPHQYLLTTKKAFTHDDVLQKKTELANGFFYIEAVIEDMSDDIGTFRCGNPPEWYFLNKVVPKAVGRLKDLPSLIDSFYEEQVKMMDANVCSVISNLKGKGKGHLVTQESLLHLKAPIQRFFSFLYSMAHEIIQMLLWDLHSGPKKEKKEVILSEYKEPRFPGILSPP